MSKIDSLLSISAAQVTYSLPLDNVNEILPIKEVHLTPVADSVIRGSLLVRGTPIPLLDLRACLGKQTLLDERKELVELLNKREQDHIDWLEELVLSVKEGRQFKKTTDPTKCAFGQWYYKYKPDSPEIERELVAFEDPHNAIHKVGIEVADFVLNGKMEEAYKRLDSARKFELGRMLSLFSDLKSMLINNIREIAIVVSEGDRKTALVVDSVIDIKPRSKFGNQDFQIEGLSPFILQPLIYNNQTIFMLNIERLFSKSSVALCSRQVDTTYA